MTSPLKLPDDAWPDDPPGQITIRTVMVGVTAVSLTFAAVASMVVPIFVLFVIGFCLIVALAQWRLFGGRRPILAAVLAGGFYFGMFNFFEFAYWLRLDLMEGVMVGAIALAAGMFFGLIVGAAFYGLYYLAFISVEESRP